MVHVNLEYEGTISVMEYIKENPLKENEYYHFYTYNYDGGLLASKLNKTPEQIEELFEICGEWFEYKGMKRNGDPRLGWYAYIDGVMYYISRFK